MLAYDANTRNDSCSIERNINGIIYDVSTPCPNPHRVMTPVDITTHMSINSEGIIINMPNGLDFSETFDIS